MEVDTATRAIQVITRRATPLVIQVIILQATPRVILIPRHLILILRPLIQGEF
jgi:hypothetical protein